MGISGSLKFDEEYSWYEGIIHLDYATMTKESLGAYGSQSSSQSTGNIKITIFDDYKSDRSIKKTAYNTIEYIEENQVIIFDEICNNLIKNYNRYLDSDSVTFMKEKGTDSIFQSIESVKKSIGISDLFILDLNKNGINFFGIAVTCYWEVEINVGFIFYKTKLLRVGPSSMAFQSQYAEEYIDNA